MKIAGFQALNPQLSIIVSFGIVKGRASQVFKGRFGDDAPRAACGR